MDPRELAAIFVGGCLGAVARAGLAHLFPHGPAAWPWPTFLVNVAGAFLLGYVVTRLQERLPISAYRRPLLGTGFCGAFTTFSTMEVEVLDMLRTGAVTLAVGYVALSMAAGFTALMLGTAVVRRVGIVR